MNLVLSMAQCGVEDALIEKLVEPFLKIAKRVFGIE